MSKPSQAATYVLDRALIGAFTAFSFGLVGVYAFILGT
jgi:hypothetical protein